MIIVTGGAGFIGSHIVDEFIEKGEEVVVIDNLEFSEKSNLNKKAKLMNQDISKEGFVDSIFNELKESKISNFPLCC